MASSKKKVTSKTSTARRGKAKAKPAARSKSTTRGRSPSTRDHTEKKRGGHVPTAKRSAPRPRSNASKERAKVEKKHAAELAARRARYAAKVEAAARAVRQHAAKLSQRRARALQQRDPKAFQVEQRKRLDRNKRARERYAEKKSGERVRGERDRLLGPLEGGAGLHGRSRDDWMVLKAKRRAEDKEWRAFLRFCENEGWSTHEAADEWFSPEM